MQKQLKKPLAIYLHWPYCLKKCPYCDFASAPTKNINEDILYAGYRKDMAYFSKLTQNHQVTSIFFGGGTPSLMSPQLLEKILIDLNTYFDIDKNAEITIEANPDALPKEKIDSFHALGVNRLSLGVQALNDPDLKALGRTHSTQTALDKIDEISAVFSNFNIDLMYARGNQTLKNWESELLFALSLDLPHHSLYQLTIEENTPFFKQKINTPAESICSDMLNLTYDIMTQKNIPPYEISNFAKQGHMCKHNLAYWQGTDYIGLGPSAHGRVGNMATFSDNQVGPWLKNGILCEQLSEKERNLEKLIMNTRLINIGIPKNLTTPDKLKQARDKNWITYNENEHIFYTTLSGRLVLNQLILLLS